MVTGAMNLAPVIGVSSFLACTICGQLGFALLLDAIGGFGYPVRTLGGERLAGILVAVVGTVIICMQSISGAPSSAHESLKYGKLDLGTLELDGDGDSDDEKTLPAIELVGRTRSVNEKYDVVGQSHPDDDVEI
jgi:hypothetical protein